MLIRPSREELKDFHPDYTIYNAGKFPANRYTEGMTSGTSVAINFEQKEMVILGTEYAGEFISFLPCLRESELSGFETHPHQLT
jgi:phosphoenolpyruvate carboxykinase (ATP)